jgi:outer membrane protein assembly factor BamB
VGGDLAIVALSDATVRAFAMDSGDERWSSRPGTTPTLFESAVVQLDDAVYMSDSIGLTGSAYRIDRSTGEVVWDFAINESIIRGAPVLIGDALLVATSDGSLNAIDTATGERIWRDVRGGSLSSLAPAGSVVVGVRGGDRAGLDAFAFNPSGRLVREASPTTPDYASNFANFAIAAVPFAALALVAGTLLASRMGPAFEDEDEEEE